jgi:hypothetical protein
MQSFHLSFSTRPRWQQEALLWPSVICQLDEERNSFVELMLVDEEGEPRGIEPDVSSGKYVTSQVYTFHNS